MNQYPTLAMGDFLFQRPNYQVQAQTSVAPAQEKLVIPEPVPAKDASVINDHLQELEPVQTNPTFIKKFQDSFMEVQGLSQTLRGLSVGVMVMGGFFCVLSLFSMLAMTRAHHEQRGRLQASNQQPNFELSAAGFSSMVSTFIWGLVMAKAKQGFNAVQSGKHENVQGSVKKAIVLVALIGAALCVKIGTDSALNTHQLQKVQPIKAKAPIVKGRNLKAFNNKDELLALKDTNFALFQAKMRDMYGEKQKFGGDEDYVPHTKSQKFGGDEDYFPHGKAKTLSKSKPTTKANRLEQNQHMVRNQLRGASFISVFFVIAISAAYMVVLHKYQASLLRHEQLLAIYKNPQARVVPQHRAHEILSSIMQAQQPVLTAEQIQQNQLQEQLQKLLTQQLQQQQPIQTPEVVQQQQLQSALNQLLGQPSMLAQALPQVTPQPTAFEKLLAEHAPKNLYIPPQMPEIKEEKSEVKIEVPTTLNLPPNTKVEEGEFNYSVCESIDYQHDNEAPKATYSLQQVQDLIAKLQAPVVQEAPKEEVKPIIMTKEQFMQLLPQAAPQNASMKESVNNGMI